MTKVIYAGVLMEWVKSWLKMDHYYHPSEKQNDIPISELEDIIKRMPTVDAVPVRHGKWVYRKFEVNGLEYEGKCYCSACGTDALTDHGFEYMTRFCPNCGARMDAERKEEKKDEM